MSKVALIGYGNVGYHLFKRMSEKHEVDVFGRTDKDGIKAMDQLDSANYDFVILTVSDKAICEVAQQINHSDAIILHTSGFRPITDLSSHSRYGVMYPLQTFSIEKPMDLFSFPIFIESNENTHKEILFSFVRSFCNDVRFLSSRDRKKLHLAAVFACNFTNHLYHISHKLLEEIGFSFSEIAHLAKETIEKAAMLTPKKAQTGPARRQDIETIYGHLEMMENKDWKNIYQLLTDHIRKG